MIGIESTHPRNEPIGIVLCCEQSLGVWRGGVISCLHSLCFHPSDFYWTALCRLLQCAVFFLKCSLKKVELRIFFRKASGGGGARPTENIFACEEENVRPENTCKLFQVHVFTKNSNSVKVHFQ